MPNHVTNKLLFASADAGKVLTECAGRGRLLDFGTLVPEPPGLYHGDLSSEDEEDFPLNWLSWSKQNWGTKRNSYGCKAGTAPDGRAFVQFDTAWSLPYPVLAALANKYRVAFEHRYFDEGHNFWGVETWGLDNDTPIRLTKRKSDGADKQALCMELKGYDPDAEDEAV